MRHTIANPLSLSMLLSMLLIGCGGGPETSPNTSQTPTVGVDAGGATAVLVRTITEVKPSAMAVGEQAKITCLALNGAGETAPVTSFTVNVEPEGVVTVAGDVLTGAAEGQATVSCRSGDLPSTPATVNVTGAPLVELALSGPTTSIQVGQPASMTCVGTDAKGGKVTLGPASLSFTAPLQAVPGFSAVTSKKVGTFAVTCKVGDAGLTSNEVQVDFVPGAAVSMEVGVAPASIVAGGVGAQVTCRMKDLFGNLTTDGPKPVVLVPEEVSLIDGVVSSKKAGKHIIRCAAPPVQEAQGELTVTPGPADFSKVSVAQPQVKAGQGWNATCSAFDAFGNPVQVPAAGWQIEVKPGCAKQGGQFVCTAAGDKQVRCLHPTLNDAVPNTVVVTAAAPTSLALKFDPTLGNYATGQVVSVIGVAKDKYGNTLDDPKLSQLKMTPQGGSVDGLNQQVSCEQDGLYTISASLQTAPQLSANKSLLCDSTGPLINVTSPKRASTRIHSSLVSVKLSVVDELSPTKSTTLQGKPVTPASGVSLSKTVPAVHGLNLIKVTSRDKWDNDSALSQSFYSAKAYAKTETKHGAAAALPNGLEAWLGQPVIDSGKRYHSNPKDIATVLEVILKDFDLSALTAGSFPVKKYGFSFLVKIKSVKFGDSSINKGYPSAKLTAKTGGMNLAATLHKLDVKVKAEGKNWVSPNLDITVTAKSMDVSASVAAALSASGSTKVTTSGVSVKLKDLKVKVDNSWGWLVNWLISLFNGSITDSLQSAVEEQLKTALDGPLASVVDAFALNMNFQVPGLFGAAATNVQLGSKLTGLTFFGPGGGSYGGARLRLKASMTSTKKVPHYVLGSVLRRSCLKTTQTLAKLKTSKPMAVSLHFDSLNQFMAALWQAGGLKFKITQAALPDVDLKSFGFDGLSGDVELLLPPLLNDCGPGGKLTMQAGDMKAKLTLTKGKEKLTMLAYISLSANVSAVASAQGVSLKVGGFDKLETYVAAVTVDGKPAGQSSAAFFNQFAPMLATAVATQLQGVLATIPLPELDLTLLSKSLPKGAKLALSISSVEQTPGHLMAVGSVK